MPINPLDLVPYFLGFIVVPCFAFQTLALLLIFKFKKWHQNILVIALNALIWFLACRLLTEWLFMWVFANLLFTICLAILEY